MHFLLPTLFSLLALAIFGCAVLLGRFVYLKWLLRKRLQANSTILRSAKRWETR